MKKSDCRYLVCVRCFTYNHSEYIIDALNGFVMQQTDFPYVCCIVDDASTDGAQDVIRTFLKDQFDVQESSVSYEEEREYAHISYAQHRTNRNCYFAVLFLKSNHYQCRKPKAPYIAAWRDKCKYEALCEGDDFWIDPLKLQKQVDFLNSHSGYSMCSHRIYKYDQDTVHFLQDSLDYIFDGNEGFDYDKNTKVWLYETCSVMYRTDAIIEYNLYKGNKRDCVRNYFLLKYSKGFIINSYMGVYRLSDSGIYAKKTRMEQLYGSYKCYKELYRHEHTKVSRRKYYTVYASLFVASRGKILLQERPDLVKILSLIYYIPKKLFNFRNIYKPIGCEMNSELIKRYINTA